MNCGADIQMGTYVRLEQIDLGVIDVDKVEHVRGHTERPVHTYRVSMGVYMISRRVRDAIPQGSRFDMPDLVGAALSRKIQRHGSGDANVYGSTSAVPMITRKRSDSWLPTVRRSLSGHVIARY